MAVKASLSMTYADVAKRTDPDGKIATIVEILSEFNEIIDDMRVIECNNGTKHKTTVRTGLPEAYWRSINEGVPTSKSFAAPVEDVTGMLEVYSDVDKDLADLNGNTAAFRLSETKPFFEAMSQQMAETVFYGNPEREPKKFLGFAPRYSTLDKTKAQSAENVVDAGGRGVDNTSIWLVTWGDDASHGIFPKGLKAGYQHEDKGQQTLFDKDGNRYEGYVDHHKWNLGLTTRDWRKNVRIANIDMSDVKAADPDTLKALLRHMIIASEMLRGSSGTRVWYVNRQLRSWLRIAALEKIANNLTWETISGKKFLMFDEMPVRLVEQLINNEQAVV